ncbi:FecR family protein [Spirosoma sp.]|uniref:FecR family protein n=1 Tax=Spirosoma sp. TaxID=1899569 RepID=UPI003B3A530D
MPDKPYSAYTAEDFALDDLFVRWVQHPDDEEVAAYWENWLTNHPYRSQIIETARDIILTASQPASPALSSDEISSVWGRIRVSLQGMEDIRPLQPDVRAVVGWWYFIRTIAATLGVILLIGWALWMQYGPNQCISTINTLGQQTRKIRLPDNSTVMLYPNSRIQYARSWNDESPRAVWLNGEADFSIVHRADTSSARIFRVHTGGLTIEAIGTAFQVRQCDKGTRVALTSGQVNLLVKQQKPIRLKPGESIEIATDSSKALP